MHQREQHANSVILLAALAIGALLVSACSGADGAVSPAPVLIPSAAAPTVAARTAPAASAPAPSVSVTPTPTSPPRSGPVQLSTGTVSIKITVGSNEESITAPLYKGYVLLDGTPGDTLDASWLNTVSGNISGGLDLNVPGLLSGTYEIDPTVRDSRQPYVALFAAVLRGTVDPLSCAIVVDRTPTDGVAGTIDCEGRLRDVLDPVTAKGTFDAEP